MKSSKILLLSLVLAVISNANAITISYADQLMAVPTPQEEFSLYGLSMAVPTEQEEFPLYGPIASPIISTDPSQAMPIGLGSVATGGDTISVRVGLGRLSGPVDIYFAYYSPSIDPQNIYILTSDYTFIPLSVMDPLHEGPTPWKISVSNGVNESLESALGNIPISSLPPGTYYAYLLVTPAGRLDSYYLWTTAVDVVDNVLSITVNGSLCSDNSYINKPCVNVTVCTPGTSICQIISDILLDTGSYGLRIFKQVLNVTLAQEIGASGSVAECIQYGDGSSNWGPVQMASVILGNEPAVDVPIQVIDSTFGSAPAGCKNADTGPADAGFNGILGVGFFDHDCGSVCANSADNGIYYGCTGSNCIGTMVPLSSQVQNPVALLPQDNNGVIVQLPSVPPDGSPSVNGNLILGIGTQSNNTPSAVTTYAADQFGEFVTTFNHTLYSGFIDTGSNGLFFPSPSASLLPSCAFPNAAWFCPLSIVSLSATNTGASGSATGAVPFQIGNLNSLTSSSNNVFDDIGGDQQGEFDWGLPFFFGRNVFLGFEGRGSGLGTGPYWAY